MDGSGISGLGIIIPALTSNLAKQAREDESAAGLPKETAAGYLELTTFGLLPGAGNIRENGRKRQYAGRFTTIRGGK